MKKQIIISDNGGYLRTSSTFTMWGIVDDREVKVIHDMDGNIRSDYFNVYDLETDRCIGTSDDYEEDFI